MPSLHCLFAKLNTDYVLACLLVKLASGAVCSSPSSSLWILYWRHSTTKSSHDCVDAKNIGEPLDKCNLHLHYEGSVVLVAQYQKYYQKKNGNIIEVVRMTRGIERTVWEQLIRLEDFSLHKIQLRVGMMQVHKIRKGVRTGNRDQHSFQCGS